jgi:hypothetical protein
MSNRNTELWDLALDECNRKWLETESPVDFANGADWGARWLAAVVGMAMAVQKNAPRLVERRYWETDPRYYDCWCPGCGAYMKMRDAGVDEGTDYEWCGSCRY